MYQRDESQYEKKLKEEQFKRFKNVMDQFVSPQPEAVRPKQIPAVIGCDSGWIKCSDRFPENRQIVLAYNPVSGVNQAEYCNGGWSNRFTLLACGDKSDTWFPNVTHWMPLPKPPEHGR